MAKGPKTGLLDLEKELECSICTDILYQPLTLLDCLHTFCGSCLKEWFSFAAASRNSTSSGNSSAFTCPSCRAVVRETRPNATVTTLLDMFIQANPERRKTEVQRDEIAQTYKPGDELLPRRRERERTREDPRERRGRGHRNRQAETDELDHRLVDDVRELNPRDTQTSSQEHAHDRRHGRGHVHRRGPSGSRATDFSAQVEQPAGSRSVEHQSSLRSLLSVSRRGSVDDLDSQEMEAEIMRQIVEEDLLEGYDLNNLDEEQEEEIGQRIAQAYLRRQRQRTSRIDTADRPALSSRRASRENQHNQTHTTSTGDISIRTRPPVSRPYLLQQVSGGDEERRQRSSSQGPHRSLRPPGNRRSSGDDQRPASRSATDLSNQPRTVEASEERARRSSHERRSTDPDRPRASELWQRRGTRGIPHVRTLSGGAFNHEESERPTSGGAAVERSSRGESNVVNLLDRSRHNGELTPRSASSPRLANQVETRTEPASRLLKSRPVLYLEPSIYCDRCHKEHIEYQLHYSCPACQSGNFHLCLQCYRQGKGCLNWFGFGHNAWKTYHNRAPANGYASDHERPHFPRPNRYLRPRKPATRNITNAAMTDENPLERLQRGVFCSNCLANTNDCFWQCDWCNDGDWGFCNTCVNQGTCCMHPLKARVCQFGPAPQASATASQTTSLAIPVNVLATVSQAPTLLPILPTPTCNHCNDAISPATPHHHCPSSSPLCHAGDYDIHLSCYDELLSSGNIRSASAQRRCPNGHRMQIIGFADDEMTCPQGQPVGELRRVVIEDVAGGWLANDREQIGGGPDRELVWKEGDGSVKRLRRSEAASSQGAPSGGGSAGQAIEPADTAPKARCVALWSWWPDSAFRNVEQGSAGAAGIGNGGNGSSGRGGQAGDELAFPKGADLREVLDVNGDWCEGVYCGRRGFFPAARVRFEV